MPCIILSNNVEHVQLFPNLKLRMDFSSASSVYRVAEKLFHCY